MVSAYRKSTYTYDIHGITESERYKLIQCIRSAKDPTLDKIADELNRFEIEVEDDNKQKAIDEVVKEIYRNEPGYRGD